MKITQHLSCDGAGVNRVEITDAAMGVTHRGTCISIPVGTNKRGYSVMVELTLADLLEMTASALGAEAEERGAREARDISAARARAQAAA